MQENERDQSIQDLVDQVLAGKAERPPELLMIDLEVIIEDAEDCGDVLDPKYAEALARLREEEAAEVVKAREWAQKAPVRAQKRSDGCLVFGLAEFDCNEIERLFRFEESRDVAADVLFSRHREWFEQNTQGPGATQG